MDRALLVGVNQYPTAPLQGCVNDVWTIRNLLIRHYGFDPSSIHTVLDQYATTAGIWEGLRWLVQASPGDRLLLHFSGHGVQFPDVSEDDRLSEAICPIDFDWTAEHAITDDQLFCLFSELPEGVRFYFISDSCHSQGQTNLTRNISSRPRVFPGGSRHSGRPGTRSLIQSVLDVGFLSACRSDQTAADTVIDGVPCGAFTHYLAQALPSSQCLVDLIRDIGFRMLDDNYRQQPQAEGARRHHAFLA